MLANKKQITCQEFKRIWTSAKFSGMNLVCSISNSVTGPLAAGTTLI